MTNSIDIIVIGGGHNGLTCAALLAKAGHQVRLLEARDEVGGMAATHEVFSDCRAPLAAQYVHQLDAEVVRELGLEDHGLRYLPSPATTIALQVDGQHLAIQGDQLSGATAAEQQRYRELRRIMQVGASLLTKQYRSSPPSLHSNKLKDKISLASLGINIRRLGREDMRDFLRIIGISAYDLFNEYLQDERLKAAMALDAVLGSHAGPRSPGTVLTALHRLTGANAAPLNIEGGPSQVVSALAASAQHHGVKLETNAQVVQVLVKDGRVSGVELADGRTLSAAHVISGIDLKATVGCLIGAEHFETGFVRRVSHVRCRGVAARLTLRLKEAPNFNALDAQSLRQRLIIAPTMGAIERAFNPVKYAQYSEQAVMELSVIPTGSGTQHLINATVQYVPYTHAEGWSSTLKEQLKGQLIEQLAQYAPNIADYIDAQLATPIDLERDLGITGGHWHHGELALDQFYFVRPVIGAAQYQLPLEGMWMCGAGAHPGGGVSGLPGRNAAKAVLRFVKKSAPADANSSLGA